MSEHPKKLRFLTSYATSRTQFAKDKEYDVDAKDAGEIVAAGIAVEIDHEQPTAPTAAPAPTKKHRNRG
jgi:hypothetical protein